MNKLQEILSNRELASIVWLSILILVSQFNTQIQTATSNLIKAFFHPSIITISIIAIAYSTATIYILWLLNFWDQTLLKDSIIWFISTGFVLLFSLHKASKEDNFFKNIVRDNLKLTLILEFVMNFHQLSLIGELIIIPVLAFLAILQVVAEREERVRIIKPGIDWILAIVGLTLFMISIIDIANDITNFANYEKLRSFLLPIILSISFIPYAFLVALYMNYELLFDRLNQFLTNKDDLRYAKWRTFWKCKFSLSKLKILSPKINGLYNKSTRQEINEIIL